jgi:ankyrin repeat protein
MENRLPNDDPESVLERSIREGITGKFLGKRNALSVRAVSKSLSGNRGSRQSISRNENRRTLLMSKALLGHNNDMNLNIHLAKTENPQGLEVRDGNGFTALLLAASRNHTRAALKLIRAGADVNAETIFRETPLSFAVSFGNRLLVKEFLQAGANTFEIRSLNTRRTPFETAIINNDSESVYYLLEAGAEANRPGIIKLALYPEKKTILELLVGKGADINAVIEYYRTPLIIAIDNEYWPLAKITELVDILIGLGANISGSDIYTNPLQIALRGSTHLKYDIFDALLARGANPNFRGEGGGSLLSECIQTISWGGEIYGYVKLIFDRLITHPQINVNLQDKYGETPLHMAVFKSSVYCVEKLIAKGADPSIRKYTNVIHEEHGEGIEGYEGGEPLSNGVSAYEMCSQAFSTVSDHNMLAKLQAIMAIFDRPRNPNAGNARRRRVRKTRKTRKNRRLRKTRKSQ